MVHINFIHNKYLFALLYSNPHKSLEKKIINFIVQYKTMIKPLHNSHLGPVYKTA
jgi:hypothetical protein